MKSISIEVSDAADVRVIVDGSLVSEVKGAAPVASDDSDESIRHDTPPDVAIAEILFNANRDYSRWIGKPPGATWANATTQRAGMIEFVRAVIAGQITTPAEEHDRWCRMLNDDGWKYGPVESHVKKTHPALVPYPQLPAVEIRRDTWLLAMARTLAVTV